MHQKLACLLLCVTGPAVSPLVVAGGQFDAAGGGPAAAYARADTSAGVASPRWEPLFHSLDLQPGGDQMGLTDSERLQLREQIRAATRDLYPDIYQSGTSGPVSSIVVSPRALP